MNKIMIMISIIVLQNSVTIQQNIKQTNNIVITWIEIFNIVRTWNK